MLLRFLAVSVVVMSAATVSPAQAPASGKPLDIYFIDTEGGQATLYVSPSGQTLLVDTGNAGERDLGRILQVLELAGVKQIDHLFLTHYHGDHYGSMPELSKRIPIKHFYDHGDSVELQACDGLPPRRRGRARRRRRLPPLARPRRPADRARSP